MPKLSPVESEFATTEEADAYEGWFRRKVGASLRDGRPSKPHDELMEEIDALIVGSEQGPCRPA